MKTSEIEFIAEEELVDILPSTTMGTLHLISNDYGPLRTNIKTTVPLWVARQLRRSRLCRIIPPPWLTPNFLEETSEREQREREEFAPLPMNYVHMASVLLEVAPEDVPRVEEVRVAIQRLRELRAAKIQAGLPLIDGNPLKLNHVGHAELNEVRPLLLGTLDHFSAIAMVEREEQRLRILGEGGRGGSLSMNAIGGGHQKWKLSDHHDHVDTANLFSSFSNGNGEEG